MLRRKSNPARLRRSLRTTRLVGTFLKLPGVESLEVAAVAGFDFVIVDREHSQLSEARALEIVRHASARDVPAVVRVPSCDPGEVNRLLEAGAAGIQLSSVRSVEQVRELVAATRYPPDGRRSISLAHAAGGYGEASPHDLVEADPPLLVGQIETSETEDPLDSILAEGLDVAFIGALDLLVEVGFDQLRLDARIEEIAKAAAVADVALGAFAATASAIPPGVRYVALSSDVAMLRAAAAAAVATMGRSEPGAADG